MDQLGEQGIQSEIDQRDEKLGYKIREARMDRVPYMLIVGERKPPGLYYFAIPN